MPQDAVVDDPDVRDAAARLISGDVFTGLAVGDVEHRAASLDGVLKRVVDEATRLAWVGNPLRSPLTMERILLQIVGPETDLRLERSPADLARLIAQPAGSESRLLVVVQQPETLSPETREQLGALAGHLGGEAVQVQFLFSGTPALRLPEIPRAELRPLMPLAPVLLEDDMAEPAPRRRDVLPVILLLLLASLGAVFFLAGGLAPPALQPDAAAVAPLPDQPASEPATDVAGLRRQFDAFLAERAASLPPLSAGQKDGLFQEFLTRHRRE